MKTLEAKMDRAEKKLVKYLRKDRFKKFKTYADKHCVILRDVRTENEENLLHEACRLGKGYFVRYFLEKGVDPMFPNSKGEVPLHIACQCVVCGGVQDVMDNLVKPLMRKCIAAAEVEDNIGRKPRDVLRQFHEVVNHDEGETSSNYEESKYGEHHGRHQENDEEEKEQSQEDDEEEKWKRKLMEEMNYDYEEERGNYENDFAEAEKMPDTFDNWAEKIHQQRREKRQQTYLNFEEQRERKKRKKEEEQEENRKRLEDLEREHQKYLEKAKDKGKLKIKKEKKKYTEKIKEFFATERTGSSISYSDVPWPHLKSDETLAKMKEFLLSDIDSNDKERTKKYLKEQQIIWHPDRFSQKCGQYLIEDDLEKVMSKVNSVSQQLNALLTEIS